MGKAKGMFLLMLLLLFGCKSTLTEAPIDYFDDITGRYQSEQLNAILLLEHNGKQISGTCHIDGKNFSINGNYDKAFRQIFISGRAYYPQYGELEISFILFVNGQKELRGNYLMQNQYWNSGSQLIVFQFVHFLEKHNQGSLISY